jgi:hypothetical protein
MSTGEIHLLKTSWGLYDILEKRDDTMAIEENCAHLAYSISQSTKVRSETLFLD